MEAEKLRKTQQALLFALGKHSAPATLQDLIAVVPWCGAKMLYAPLAMDNLAEAGHAVAHERYHWKITGCGRIWLDASDSFGLKTKGARKGQGSVILREGENYHQAYYRQVAKARRRKGWGRANQSREPNR